MLDNINGMNPVNNKFLPSDSDAEINQKVIPKLDNLYGR